MTAIGIDTHKATLAACAVDGLGVRIPRFPATRSRVFVHPGSEAAERPTRGLGLSP